MIFSLSSYEEQSDGSGDDEILFYFVFSLSFGLII